MKVIQGIHPDILPASVVTIGMFDGVHRGHQALLASCRSHANRLGLPAVALTYDPHPSQVLRPDAPVPLLTPLAEKLPRLAQSGMDYVAVAHFTHEFSLLSPEEFLRTVLLAGLHPQVVVVGYRTTFGHSRAGTATVLREFGENLAFEVDVVEPIEVAGQPVSSSRIRECLRDGDVQLAAALLGYQYQIIGRVVHGDARGHQLGFPTANLELPPEKLVPADGVYAVDVNVPGGMRRAVINIGNRPTFDRPRSLEVHLLDFHGDLYDQILTVTFLARLRDIRPFGSADDLIRQIHDDIAHARRV